MKLIIDIPKEFEEDFNQDRFEDSLARVASDIESFGFQLAGRYEKETITMLREAFRNCKVLPEHHGRLIDADTLEEKVEKHREMLKISEYDRDLILHYTDIEMTPTIIEGE